MICYAIIHLRNKKHWYKFLWSKEFIFKNIISFENKSKIDFKPKLSFCVVYMHKYVCLCVCVCVCVLVER